MPVLDFKTAADAAAQPVETPKTILSATGPKPPLL